MSGLGGIGKTQTAVEYARCRARSSATMPQYTSTSHAAEDKTTPASPSRPQHPWNIPYLRNDYFTGREEILEQLHARFKANNATALSQRTASEPAVGLASTDESGNAYRYHQEYQAVLWARAESHEALTSSFVEIAGLLDFPQKDEQDQTLMCRL